jgi:hypothetical protein
MPFSPSRRVVWLSAAALAVFLLLLGSCAGEQKEALIPAAEEYRSWPRTTDTELNYPIPGHENNYRKIYISPDGLDYSKTESSGRVRYSFPPGTVIIKEIYQGFDPPKNEEPMRLTAMVKQPEADRSRGGWIWVMKNTASGKERIITEEFCVTCHSNANESHPYGDGNPREEFRDFVYFLPREE